MISNCPHCKKTLTLGDAQKAKLQKALDALEPGKKLTIKCPACTKPIVLESTGSGSTSGAGGISPPPPPDLKWLKESAMQEGERLEDVPMALVLYPDNDQKDLVRDALEQVGYQVVFGTDINDARERMRFTNFACVVLHSTFESPTLASSTFHRYMSDMSMQRRRYLFYILIGPEFNTLYNLEALAHSANLVVNVKDLLNLGLALRRAIPMYEELFGPFMEELTSAGKS